ncbi:hypothetical protein MBLNU13_g05289t1 [Cladosporium sp. NU13]
MDFQPRTTDLPTPDLDMAFGWQSDVCNNFFGNSRYALDAPGANVPDMSNQLNVQPNFAEEISFKLVTPFTPGFGALESTMDPTNLWPASMDQLDMHNAPPMPTPIRTSPTLNMHRNSPSCSPMTIARRRSIAEGSRSSVTPSTSTPDSANSYGRPPSAQVSTTASTADDSPVSSSPIESEKTRRARYAANQRHNKAKQARKDSHQSEGTGIADARAAERKQRHREKNKVAAAKCRSRQRKQVQTIQEKGDRLEEKNIQVKTMIQELRSELNSLRSMALDHQECSCLVARYNHDQAERVVAEYRSACLG